MNVLISSWGYQDGWSTMLNHNTGHYEQKFNHDMVGWVCWAYTDDTQQFCTWMKENMIGDFDCTPRFNSGNPMCTVVIRGEQDATLFKLTWM